MKADPLYVAKGQCQCTGQCGHNHQWVATQPPAQCRAPHGGRILRKLNHPTWWILAATDEIKVAYPEYYSPKEIEVTLAPITLAGKTIVVCQRCKLLIERQSDETAVDET